MKQYENLTIFQMIKLKRQYEKINGVVPEYERFKMEERVNE